MSTATTNVSIVIPVLNDASALKRCLDALQLWKKDAQIIVVDGGPGDGCKHAAIAAGAEYLVAPRGRASQMNAGVAHAHGEWLWFLHADCIPHPDSLQAIAQLKPPVPGQGAAWGCFNHRIDAPGLALRLIERADNIRARFFSLPYGDQGIFVHRKLFEKIGGYDSVPLLEDVILARTLAKSSRPKVLAPLLKSDARRWLERGVLRTTFINWKIMWLFLFKCRTPQQLAEIYRGTAPHHTRPRPENAAP